MAEVTISVAQGSIENPTFILKAVGATLLASAQKAFLDQRLGSIKWRGRYPSQRPPVLNIAGALQDFGKNRDKPKGRRFVRTPVGMDTRLLYLSLAKNKGDNLAIKGRFVVEVGSTVPYAGKFQNGGISVQQVTGAAKKRMAKWMKGLRGKRRKIATFNASSGEWGPKKSGGKKKKKKTAGASSKKKGTPKKAKKGTAKPKGYTNPKSSLTGSKKAAFNDASAAIAGAQKMAFLFRKKTLRTKLVPRPFLGITAASRREITRIVEEGIERGRR